MPKSHDTLSSAFTQDHRAPYRPSSKAERDALIATRTKPRLHPHPSPGKFIARNVNSRIEADREARIDFIDGRLKRKRDVARDGFLRARYTQEETSMSEQSNGPDFVAYTVRDRGPEKDAAWNRVGAAWRHRDGKGYDLQLDATPVDGRVTLREQRRDEYTESRTNNPNRARDQERNR